MEENKFYSKLFNYCLEPGTQEIPALKATELFRSANLTNETIRQITTLSNVPQTALYLTRQQFFSCLKLIAAHQKSLDLTKDLLVSTTLQLPLPKFSWNTDLIDSAATNVSNSSISSSSSCASSSSTINRDNIATQPLASTANGLLVVDRFRSPDLIQLNSHNHKEQAESINSTDSEVEANESEPRPSRRKSSGAMGSSKQVNPSGRSGNPNNTQGASPETWSTASDSPTPTNSVAERPWAVGSQSWQGLLCEEQTQLLGTEEESSDKHSSEEEDEDIDLEALYQITVEQKDYYIKQFRAVQPDLNGLLSGVVAKIFFEKSRIPIEELRHIWQLCDVTRDGALDLAEFTAAMHLVVLRRNNIPIPSSLPACLQPKLLQKALGYKGAPAREADLLNLESDDNQEVGLTSSQKKINEYKRLATVDGTGGASKEIVLNKSSTLPKNHHSQYRLDFDDAKTFNQLNNNVANNVSSLGSNNNVISDIVDRSRSNSPSLQQESLVSVVDGAGDHSSPKNNKEWTKFTESPTSNVSSPGPKPVNVTQAIVSDTHVLHPVPLRVTPVAPEIVEDEAIRTFRKADTLVYESGIIIPHDNGASPKFHRNKYHNVSTGFNLHNQRESLPTDLRAIQRPQPKKPASKNIGAIPPPPPQRENSFNQGEEQTVTISTGNNNIITLSSKKNEAPPLPPPRPHRHTRSSSLDLQKIKLSSQQEVPPPVIPPPRISDKQMSYDASIESSRKISNDQNDHQTSFADFTQFPNTKTGEFVTTIHLDSQPQPPRSSLTNSLIGQSSYNRTSAFEVYRKPTITPRARNSQSPPPVAPVPLQTQNSVGEIPPRVSQDYDKYEKQVTAMIVSDTLRQVRFKPDQNLSHVVKHLKEQNLLLLRLCSDLSDELSGVQRKKEEIKTKLEIQNNYNNNVQ